MAAPPALDIQPLMYEPEAAKLIGVPARALRSERTAGRIQYRKVAGRIMYRLDDLKNWQENIACPVAPKAQSSDPIRRGEVYSTSSGPMSADGAASVARALATTARLRQSLRSGSAPKPDPSNGPGQLVPLRRE
jgi:hypothetical protein